MSSGGKPTILIVDDDPSLQRMLAEVLTLEGYPIELAGEGKTALEFVERDPNEARIMLLDLNMPVMDGWAVLRWLQEHADIRSHIKVVIISANNYLATVPDEQVDAKIAKPLSVDAMLMKLSTLG